MNFDTSERTLRDIFSKYGEIEKISIVYDRKVFGMPNIGHSVLWQCSSLYLCALKF